MNKTFEYIGAGVVGAGLVLLLMWFTGKFDKCLPEIIETSNAEIQFIDTCVTVVKEKVITKKEMVKGDTVWLTSKPDTVYVKETVVEGLVKEYTYPIERVGDYYWLYDEFTVSGENVEFINLESKFRLDTVMLENTFREVNTVVVKPNPIVREYKTNVIKLGYQTTVGRDVMHGPSVSVNFKNQVQFRVSKYTNAIGGVVGLEIPIIKIK